MNDTGLIVFDVDGTLLRGETICELIAHQIGKSDRMAELEKGGGAGKDHVIASRREMADWYLTAGSSVINRFVPINNWAPNASLGIELLINGGWHVAIASVTWKFAVEKVAEKLGIADVLATGLHWESGSIDHVFPEDKARFMKQLALKRGIPMSRVAAVGDSSGDYPMLTAACHGIFVGTEEPALPDVAHMPNAAIDQIAEYVLGLPVD